MNINFVPPTISTKKAYSGKRISVRLDEVNCGLESTVLREVVEHPGAVVILPIGKNGEITLVRQYRHALDRIMIECPAGTREIGEDPLSTAKRELAEEAKLTATTWDFLGQLHPVPGFSTEAQELYLARNLSVTYADTDPGEYIEVMQVTLKEIKDMIKNSLITDSKTICIIYRAELLGYLDV
jgi:ADP-ribose pyrophosphatase